MPLIVDEEVWLPVILAFGVVPSALGSKGWAKSSVLSDCELSIRVALIVTSQESNGVKRQILAEIVLEYSQILIRVRDSGP